MRFQLWPDLEVMIRGSGRSSIDHGCSHRKLADTYVLSTASGATPCS